MSRVQGGFWVAASGSGAQFLVPAQAPNATTVSPAAAVAVGLAAIPGTTVAVGGSVILRATSSLASARQEIVFQARPAGSDAFAPIGTVTTDASGRADLRVNATATTSYQVTLIGNGSAGATSAALDHHGRAEGDPAVSRPARAPAWRPPTASPSRSGAARTSRSGSA